jgi:hypothetical protein
MQRVTVLVKATMPLGPGRSVKYLEDSDGTKLLYFVAVSLED